MVEQKTKVAAVKKAATATKSKNAASEAPVAKKVVAKKAAPAEKKTAAPAVKKAAATTAKKAATPAAEKKAAAKKAGVKPSPEERYRMVEMAAYFTAERHGFQGNSTEHWAAAEREIAALLGE